MGLTHHLSEYLQSTSVDISVALEHVDLVLTKVEEMSADSEAELIKIFDACEKSASDFGATC